MSDLVLLIAGPLNYVEVYSPNGNCQYELAPFTVDSLSSSIGKEPFTCCVAIGIEQSFVLTRSVQGVFLLHLSTSFEIFVKTRNQAGGIN
jgi:hypothetical protein